MERIDFQWMYSRPTNSQVTISQFLVRVCNSPFINFHFPLPSFGTGFGIPKDVWQWFLPAISSSTSLRPVSNIMFQTILQYPSATKHLTPKKLSGWKSMNVNIGVSQELERQKEFHQKSSMLVMNKLLFRVADFEYRMQVFTPSENKDRD